MHNRRHQNLEYPYLIVGQEKLIAQGKQGSRFGMSCYLILRSMFYYKKVPEDGDICKEVLKADGRITP